MAVSIRLTRMGRKKAPFYRVVVADERCRRDGRFIEQIGYYNPRRKEECSLDVKRAAHWVAQGAKPTETVAELLRRAG